MKEEKMDWKGMFRIMKNMCLWTLTPVSFFMMWYYSLLIILYGMQDLDKALENLSLLMSQISKILEIYVIIMALVFIVQIFIFIVKQPVKKEVSKQ